MSLTLRAADTLVSFNLANQQLVQLQHAGIEYLHGGGKAAAEKTAADKLGWPNTEIIMFPIVGPAKDGVLILHRKPCRMGQHGILRHLQFELVHHDTQSATFRCVHKGEPVRSTKNADETYDWPFACTVEKTYLVSSGKLAVTFTITNTSEWNMPYMLGWHPAFRLTEGTFNTSTGAHTIEEVKTASRNGALLLRHPTISFETPDHILTVSSDMGGLMVWSPDAPLFCIEPVTQFALFSGTSMTSARMLQPGQKKSYHATIEIQNRQKPF